MSYKGEQGPRAMVEREIYITNKVVEVEEMSRLEYVLSRGWELPEDEEHLKDERVYKVMYLDGYISMCPKDKFLEDARKLDKLDFGLALLLMKKGFRVAREGWNGKGMFVYLVTGGNYPVQMGAIKEYANEQGTVKYNPYMAIKNVNNSISTWVPSVNDCLAEDWQAVGEEKDFHKILIKEKVREYMAR